MRAAATEGTQAKGIQPCPSGTGLSLLPADIAALRAFYGRAMPLAFPNIFAVAMYRLSRSLRRLKLAPVARVVAAVNQVLTGADIDPSARIGPGFHIAHTVGVVIGTEVVAGARLRLYGGALLGATFNGEQSKRPGRGHPTLGDDVTLSAKASILGPVTIGDRVMVGAHALVLDDMPSDCMAYGIPARAVTRAEAA